MRVVESVVIGSPAPDVWDVVSDPATHTSWRPALREFRQVSNGPLGVGSRIREVLSWRGRDIEIEDEVTAFDPPRRLALRGGWKTADFDVDFRLEPEADGTRVTMEWPLYPKSFLLKVAAPLMGGAMRKATREELALLKEYVEERARSTRELA